MRKPRYLVLAVLYGAFSAVVATLVSVLAAALMGTSMTGQTLISALIVGIGVFVVGVLTVLFVWPRIGFDPFDSHPHEPA